MNVIRTVILIMAFIATALIVWHYLQIELPGIVHPLSEIVRRNGLDHFRLPGGGRKEEVTMTQPLSPGEV